MLAIVNDYNRQLKITLFSMHFDFTSSSGMRNKSSLQLINNDVNEVIKLQRSISFLTFFVLFSITITLCNTAPEKV